MRYKLGELFAGPGGIGLAAKLAKVNAGGKLYSIEHEWATDYDKDSCETYKFNLIDNNNSKVVCKDIRKLKFEELAPIDGLAFGFPCNDFSVVGEQKGVNGVFGPLYSYGIRALEYFEPDWFFAENVGGLQNTDEGSVFKQILYEMEKAGYRITPHLYKFEQYGVPQARHRIIIIGIRRDHDLKYKVPAPTHEIPITVREAIENPPINDDAPNNTATKHAKQVIERLKHIKPGENAFTADLPQELQLNVKGATLSHIYKRLEPDKPAYTITGSGGGGTHVYHWDEPRALTNRERARLQTFPDNYIFKGSKESIRKQIGMAVPPIGAKVIFEAVLKTFAGASYPIVEPNMAEYVNSEDGATESLFSKV